jgi:hypothetical protein
LKKDRIKVNLTVLKEPNLSAFYKMLYKYHNCFAEKTSDLGGTDIIEFEINLENSKPIFYRPYRYSEYERSIIREKTKDLLENNIIRTSSSTRSYASPAVLVKKKNG